MAVMEGPLSKWTNVMKGWQYRWFVLDENAGLLSYYTSKEKMMRGARRGCVRLRGAVIGIDDEDDSTFTITVDMKTFHFQARDIEEKEKWIDALESTIVRHTQPSQKWESSKPVASVADFDCKLTETDAYLQILIEQVQTLDAQIEHCEDEVAREKYNAIKSTAEAMIESIKQSIVLLQITKQNVHSDSPLVNGVSTDSLTTDGINIDVPEGHSNEAKRQSKVSSSSEQCGKSRSTECIQEDLLLPDSPDGALSAYASNYSTSMPNLSSHPNNRGSVQSMSVSTSGTVASQTSSVDNLPSPAQEATNTNNLTAPAMPAFPDRSYSSDDDDDFFDAEDNVGSQANGVDSDDEPQTPLTVIASDDDYFDELYDDTHEEELDSLDKHGSLITYLLSQVRIGMDLTKIVLPTFILEKRSLLEMFADFIAHPDLFIGIVDKPTPRERMVQCVKWYMSAFHAGRRSNVAKKPYNPIIGEVFRCFYDVPGEARSGVKADDGPVPWASRNNVCSIAEQVSHHPPISAFYAEHYNKRISIDGYIWTKSKFLGLSIGVHMIGQAVISLLDLEEEYMITFPNAYGRSILTVPWMELGGKITVTCAKTGYSSNIEFHTKPFYGGKKDQITAEIFGPSEKKPFCVIKGEWNGAMWARYDSGQNEMFLDTKTMAVVKKRVQPIDQQEEFESRRLWQDVTYHLKHKNMEEATAGKHKLEQRQREEAKQRKEAGEKWETKHFHEVGEHWVYDRPLVKRLGQQNLS